MNNTQSARPILVAVRTPTRSARAIDRLSCDVLIVKPRGFKSPVRRQANRQVIQPPRGRSLSHRQRQSSGGATYVTH